MTAVATRATRGRHFHRKMVPESRLSKLNIYMYFIICGDISCISKTNKDTNNNTKWVENVNTEVLKCILCLLCKI